MIAAVISACFASTPAWGNPTAPQVVNGSASFNQAGNLLTVNNTNGAIINWNTFSIGANETTRFNQASAASSVLNRVIANDPSVLLGTLSSNGRVWLVNPAGIMVGQGARIDVAGFIASTLNVRNEDFLAGRLNFGATPNAGSIQNYGQITTPTGGSVYLIAPNVENRGIINAPNGEVILAAGQTARLIDTGTPGVKVDITGAEGDVTNLGEIVAEAGRIGMAGVLVKNSGTLNASSVVKEGGRIFLKADILAHTGEIRAEGRSGGSIRAQARNVLSAGRMSADGAQGPGGEVDVQAGYRIVQTAAADLSADSANGNGGAVTLQAVDGNFASGTLRATGGTKGGDIRLLGRDIVLAGATLDASGNAGGGSVLVGGDFQGKNFDVANAGRTWINYSSAIRADARQQGDGGKVIVWSDQDTRYAGNISARGGAQSGNGGFIEVSGRENLIFAGMADAGAANGTPGTLLLDPKNIVIDAAGGGVSAFQLINPYPGAGNNFPATITALPNGNVVATDPYDDFAASNAGAAFFYNGTTGALISALTGSAANDRVSNGGVTALGNGNYVVRSQNWNNGLATNAGAVTFGSGATGVSGAVSAANSLVGTTANDQVGYGGVTALSNGNYVVRTLYWHNGAAAQAGAVTFGSGTTGVSGAVSAANSLVGTTAGDQVGRLDITELSNGNYVVRSPEWHNGAAVTAGAVTWSNGSGGTVGAVSAANSLVGSANYDYVGDKGVTALANGNYVVRSPDWANGALPQVGAVTWGNGSGGTVGAVSAANSLVGSQAYDLVGADGVTALANGNYVVGSRFWANGAAIHAGAVTWGNGSGGTVGAVSAANSLVGSQADDWVGSSGVTALSNGNYVVASPNWNRYGVIDVGAVTWGSGTTGVTAEVSAANSLIGFYPDSRVGSGGVTALSNGNYVVNSPGWVKDFGVTDAGAVTWGNGSGGTVGFASADNSLIGSNTFDYVGIGGVTALANGNYVVRSHRWRNGAAARAGAVTWGNGSGGTVGEVSATNSLVGSQANDYVGGDDYGYDGYYGGITFLANSNYVVRSPGWANGAAAKAGAVTWGSGTSGVAGVISAANSLIGSQANDRVGSGGVTELSNGNYVVNSFDWANGAAAEAGAVTWGSGTTGVSGVVSAANSLVGSQANDRVGLQSDGEGLFGGVTPLANGNYVVTSLRWANGAAASAGAVTWASGTTGIAGVVSAANSLVGSQANDQVGSADNYLGGGVIALSNGNYVVRSPYWNNGAATQAGAVTFGSGTAGISGAVSAGNSLVGATTDDQVSIGGIATLGNGSVVVSSRYTDNGVLVDAGLVHVLSQGGGGALSNPLAFSNDPSGSVTITPAQITAITSTGTAVTLQANNDITLSPSSDILTNNTGGNGGALTLQAGRSVPLNSSITTDNGNLSITANDPAAQAEYRDAGAGGITMAAGTTLNAGTGMVTLTVGAGVAGATGGDLIVENITGAGAGSGITTSGSLNVNGTISAGAVVVNADTFTLNGGTWNQVSATLPAFTVNDFRITGGTFIRALGGDGTSGTPYRLADIYGVQGMGNALGNSYALANSIDATGTALWNSGSGFNPVGNVGSGFTGSFYGGGYAISSLAINRPGQSYVGLFGNSSGTIDGVNLVDANVSGYQYVGALAGRNSGTVSNSSVTGLTGVVDGAEGYTGGLIGYNYGSVTGSFSMVAVSGGCCGSSVGGLVGYNDYGNISNSHATGDVTGYYNVGGLVGYNEEDGGINITNSYASGTVQGNSYVGGLVGYNAYGQIEWSYANGDVTGGGTAVGGLIGYNNESVNNVYATGNVSVNGLSDKVGGLVGHNDDSISNAYATGSVSSCYDGSCGGNVGGLVGYNYGTVNNAYATGEVSGAGYVGGLIGSSSSGTVSNTYATGNVSGTSSYIGGLIGSSGAAVSNAYATGGVSGTGTFSSYVGGLIGSSGAAVSNVYATGDVSSTSSYVGGLMGQNGGTVTNAYAAGGVSSTGTFTYIGGLVGQNLGAIDYAYASGSVTGNSYAGGLAGQNLGNINFSYSSGLVTANNNFGVLVGQQSGTVTSSAGKTVAEMQTISSFSGWSIDDAGGSGATWRIYEGNTYPLLRSFLTPLTVLANAASKDFDGVAYSGGNGVSYSVPSPLLSGTLTYGGTAQGAVNVGSYSIVPCGFYSTQEQGYDIGFANGALTINPALVSAIAVGASLTGTASKIYDGTTTATLSPGNFLLSGFSGGDSANVTQTTGSYANKNVGSGILVSASLTSGDFSPVGSTNFSNYTLPTSASGNIGVITPASVSVSGLTAQNKVYDATTAATITGTAVLSGIFGSDVVTLGGGASGSFADKNVGVAKSVNVTGLTLSGADAGNYTLSSTSAGTNADITPASLTLSGLAAQNKVYDATTLATISGTATFAGVLGSDVVTLGSNPSASFADKNVGVAKLVSVTGLTLAGADAGNYTLSNAGASTTADITPASLTLAGVTAQNKVYDATTTATITGTAAFSGVLGADVVTLGGSAVGSFVDKNVGMDKPVTATGFTLAGTDAGNYTLVSPAGFVAFITPATLTVSSVSAANKVYDATTVATVNGGSLSGLFAGDVVAVSGSGAFADKNVGVAKPVNVSGITLTGADAGNYTLSGTTTVTTADITVRPLATWIGGASGNWSSASNWDALPDLSNVQAVSVPAGVSVTYDAGAGSTNLASLTAGGLNLAGGSLNIANSLNVNSSFSLAGGALALGSGATASITQASGNLSVPALNLASLNLSVPAGAITQSGAIAATALDTQSQTGTTLNNAGNRIASFGAVNGGSGNISLTNVSPLTITGISNTVGSIAIDNTGAVTTVGPVIASSGPVTIVGHSPLTIGAGGISASGDVVLTAGNTAGSGDNLTLSGPVSSTVSGGSVALTAGDNLLQNANVTTSGGAISATAQTGNIVLTSLNAGGGSIALNAGGSIQSAPGYSGANLIGGSAVIVAGANANLSAQVNQLNVRAGGTYTVANPLTGTVVTPASSANTTAPTLNQVLTTVTSTTQQQPTQAATQAATPAPPPATTGATGSQLLSKTTTQTIGGAQGTFGGASASEADKPAADKPAEDKSASAKKDEKKDDEKKKEDDKTTAKKDEGKPAAKKLATCS